MRRRRRRDNDGGVEGSLKFRNSIVKSPKPATGVRFGLSFRVGCNLWTLCLEKFIQLGAKTGSTAGRQIVLCTRRQRRSPLRADRQFRSVIGFAREGLAHRGEYIELPPAGQERAAASGQRSCDREVAGRILERERIRCCYPTFLVHVPRPHGRSYAKQLRAARSAQTAFNAAITGSRDARTAGSRLPSKPTMTEKSSPWNTSAGVTRKRKTNSLKLSKLIVPMVPNQ